MTTIDAAAAWPVHKRLAVAALLLLLGTSLQGCETGANLFGSSSPGETQALAPAAAPLINQAKLSIAPVIGAPDAVAKQLSAQLSEAADKQRVGIASAGDKADYTVRGYVVAAREKNGVKVSYIWDVTDPNGKRVHRITGEEMAGNSDARDPWSAVSPQIISTIANRTANSLATWLPSQTQSAAGTAPVQTASVGPASPPVTAAPAARQPAAASSTASIGRDTVSATVPNVTGAPGDGSTSLAAALQRELTRSGIDVGEANGAYRVEGTVKLAPAKEGKQAIQIDWQVKDPQGKQLGTVSQKNEIPEGSLDGSWGKVADAAAGAAAQGILKLLPQAKAGG